MWRQSCALLLISIFQLRMKGKCWKATFLRKPFAGYFDTSQVFTSIQHLASEINEIIFSSIIEFQLPKRKKRWKIIRFSPQGSMVWRSFYYIETASWKKEKKPTNDEEKDWECKNFKLTKRKRTKIMQNYYATVFIRWFFIKTNCNFIFISTPLESYAIKLFIRNSPYIRKKAKTMKTFEAAKKPKRWKFVRAMQRPACTSEK